MGITHSCKCNCVIVVCCSSCCYNTSVGCDCNCGRRGDGCCCGSCTCSFCRNHIRPKSCKFVKKQLLLFNGIHRTQHPHCLFFPFDTCWCTTTELQVKSAKHVVGGGTQRQVQVPWSEATKQTTRVAVKKERSITQCHTCIKRVSIVRTYHVHTPILYCRYIHKYLSGI